VLTNVTQPLARPFLLLARRLADREPIVRPCPAGFREAAVLMLLAERPGGLHVLLCERSDDDPRDAHKGQVSLPGGRRDPGDADILATALREAREEVALDPARVRILGRLDDYLTITRYHVVPFVAAIDGFDGLAVNSTEIADIFTFPVAALRDPARVRRVPWELHGRVEDVLFIEHEGHTVWGATARMLYQLTEFIE
jgi:8-oxo-dGTP pyrophosphatase MutT (NUDIX family)